MTGKRCPDCYFTNAEAVKFCTNCGKDLQNILVYFEAPSGGDDIEITRDAVIVHKRNLTGEKSGKKEVFLRSNMEDVKIGRILSQLTFTYNGKFRVYNLRREYLDRAEELLLPPKNPDLEDSSADPLETEYEQKTTRPLFFLDGRNGQVELYDNRVEIKREGLKSILFYGSLTKGTKTIYLQDITGVEIKKPGFTVGYIQFTVPGGFEKTGGSVSSTNDENTVTFDGEKEYKIALKIKERIEKLKSGTSSTPTISVVDEIKKASELVESGILTEEEFKKLKKKLIG